MPPTIDPPTILSDIRKLLGIEEAGNAFDRDIIIHVNSALFACNQLGIGPPKGFQVTEGGNEKWEDFIQDDRIDLEAVKTLIFLKTRLIFDPPQMGYFVTALKEQIEELSWRLVLQVENPE